MVSKEEVSHLNKRNEGLLDFIKTPQMGLNIERIYLQDHLTEKHIVEHHGPQLDANVINAYDNGSKPNSLYYKQQNISF